MASVIEGFLVSLGFDVDKDELAKFNASIEAARQRFLRIGKAAVGAGIAVGAAFAKSTAEVNDLWKVSNNTGTSISGLLKLQNAVERVGGSSENVTAALNEFALKSKTFGAGFDKQVMNLVGVPLRDAAGRGRDMSAVLVDISKRLSQMAKTDPGLARMKAEAIGLGSIFDDLVRKDFPKELERSAKFATLFGKEIDEGADSSHRLANELGQVWDTIAMGAQSAAAEITETFKLDEKLSAFNDRFADGLKSVIDAEIQMLKDSSGIFDWLSKFLFEADDYQRNARIKLLEERDQKGTATADERKELSSLKAERQEDEVADRFNMNRDVARDIDLKGMADDDLKLKAKLFDVDEDDEEAMSALKRREVTTEDLTRFANDGDEADPTKFAIASTLLTRQRRGESEIVKEKTDRALMPQPPVVVPLVSDEEARQEAETLPLSSGSPIENEARARSEAEKAVRTEDNRVSNVNNDNSKSQNVTINQTVNISGAGDPAAVGQSVAKETSALVRQTQRGLF